MNTEVAFGTYKEVNLQKRYEALLDKRVPGSIRKLVKRHIKNTYGDKIIDHTDRGINMRCYPWQNVHDMKFVTGQLFSHEFHKFNYIGKNQKKIYVFIDIGANTGTVCIPISCWHPEMQVYAFEPNPVAFDRLRFNASINDISNLRLINAALGEVTKREKMFLGGNIGSSSMHSIDKTTECFVDMMRIDEFYNEFQIDGLAAIKIDIEGYEDRAMVPLFQNLSKDMWPKVVMIEHKHMHLWQENCIEFMENNGYKKVYLDDSDCILERW